MEHLKVIDENKNSNNNKDDVSPQEQFDASTSSISLNISQVAAYNNLSQCMSELSIQELPEDKNIPVQPKKLDVPKCVQSSSRSEKNVEQPQNAKTKRKTTYTKRKGVIDFGKGYEYLTCALYALKFSTSADVTDFKMSTNDNISGNFDDIRIDATFNNGERRIFLFQLKHKYKKERITHQMLTQEFLQSGKKQEKSKFHLPTYLNTIADADSTQDMTFVLYTNKESKSIEYENLLLNNEGRRGVFKFKAENNSGEEKENLKHACEKFYFFTNQACIERVKKEIKEKLKALLHCDVFDLFIKYIEFWWEQNFFLTKDNVLGKIAVLALSPYIETISGNNTNKVIEQLKNLISKFEITIVQDSERELVKDIWTEVQQEFELESTHILNLELNDNQPTDLEKCIILWHLGKVPLVLRVDKYNTKIIKDVVRLLHKKISSTKLILVGTAERIDFDEWKICGNLSDIMKTCSEEENYSNIMDKFRISLQGRDSVSLRQLIEIDEGIADFIDLKGLFTMAQEQHVVIGTHHDKLPDLHLPRTVSATFINNNQLLKLYNSTRNLIIINCDKRFQDKLIAMKNVNTVRLSEFLTGKSVQDYDRLVILSINRRCSSEDFNKVCKISNTQNTYLVQAVDDECFILLKNKSDLPFHPQKVCVEEIQIVGYSNIPFNFFAHHDQPFHPQKICIEESKIFDYFSNSLNVFCAAPGMGKSQLMQGLYNNCPSDHWAIYVDLINCNFLSAKDSTFESIKSHLLKGGKQSSDLVIQIKDILWKNRKIHVFLDGLDEVKSECVHVVLDFVKDLSLRGIPVWLSSRENLRELIFQSLNAVSIEIEELEKDQQEKYINEKIKDTYDTDAVDKIKSAVFNNVNLINSRELLGVPLQLYILTEIFRNKETYKLLEEQNIFVLTKMYKMFFDGKVETAHLKVVPKDQSHQLKLQKFGLMLVYEVPALKSCLNISDFEKLHLNVTDSNVYISEIKNSGDTNGIIKNVTENGDVIFHHQTFAEYFACVWLKKNQKELMRLREELFSNKYENLRLMLDIMLAENNPLNLAIIYKSIDYFKKNISDINIKDEGGRTALHLACAYGINCPKVLIALADINRDESWYLEMIRHLIEALNIFEVDCLLQYDCLDYALASKCLYPLELFLEKKLFSYRDIKKRILEHHDEETLAYYAAKLGYPNLLSALIEENSELVHKEVCDTHLLEVAALGLGSDVCTTPREGNIAVVKLILEKGAELNKENNGYTVLDQVCRFRKYDMILTLMENGGKCSCGNTVLHQLIKSSVEIDILVNFLEHVDVNAINQDGLRALHIACQSGNVDIVQLLLINGANAHGLDNDNKNALHHALQAPENSELITKLLIEHNVDVNCQDKCGRTTLHNACQDGNIAVVQCLVNGGADVNLVNNNKENSLHYTSKSDAECREIIFLLVKSGISANAQNKYGQTPLHLACENGNFIAADNLLKNGADVNCVDEHDRNALHYALNCSEENTEIINLLLSSDIDVNGQTKEGTTALHLACKYGDFEYTKKLTENGAEINMVDNMKDSALHYAVLNHDEFKQYEEHEEYEKIITLLITSGVDVNVQNLSGLTPLHLACNNFNLEIAELLIAKGANVNVRDYDDENALHHVLKSEMLNFNIFELLIRKGVDVYAPNKNGVTPLKLALELRLDLTIERLMENGVNSQPRHRECGVLQHGADAHEKDKYGSTTLQRECRDNGDTETVKQLVKRGENVNSVDNEGNTALHYALYSDTENLDLIILLLKHVNDVDAKNVYGTTALHIACEAGRLRSVKLLLKYGSNGNIVDLEHQNALHHASSEENQNKDLIGVLINNGVHVNCGDKTGTTPLQLACENSNYLVSKTLLECGADVNDVDNDNRNALHYALSNEVPDEKIIHLLAQKGIDVNAKDDKGTTPIHLACEMGNNEFLKILLKYRGELTLSDKDGQNALHYASSEHNRNKDIIIFLTQNGLDVDSRDNTATTPLQLACEAGNFVIAQTLLLERAQINNVDLEKDNALHYAVSANHGNLLVPRLLINKGININAQNNDGATPLHLGCDNDNVGFVHELLENGADVNRSDNDNNNALHYALKTAGDKTAATIYFLIEFGIEINAQNDEGSTALHLACQSDIVEYVEKLLHSGADVNIKDKNNRNAVDYIPGSSKNKKDIINLLKEKGISISNPAKDEDGSAL